MGGDLDFYPWFSKLYSVNLLMIEQVILGFIQPYADVFPSERQQTTFRMNVRLFGS